MIQASAMVMPGRDITVGNSFTKRRVRSGFGCDHFLENEAAKSCRSIQSGQSKGGNGQSDKLFGEIEVQTNRSHKGGSTLREGVDRAAVFKQFGQLVSRNISDGNNRADGEQTFNQHRTVADELGVAFIVELLGAGSGTDQRVEAGNSAACDSDKKNREEPLSAA